MTFSKMDIQYTWWNLTKIHQDTLAGVSVSKSHDLWVSTRQFLNGNRSIKAEAAMMLALAEVKCDQILGCKFSFGSWYQNLSDPHFFKVDFFLKVSSNHQASRKGNDILSQMIPWTFPDSTCVIWSPRDFLCEIRERLGKKNSPAGGKGSTWLGERASWEIDIKHKKPSEEAKYLAILLVAFLEWLSNPFKWLSNHQLGKKRSNWITW